MPSEKLKKVLEIIARNLTQNNIPFAVIGAIALGLYYFKADGYSQ